MLTVLAAASVLASILLTNIIKRRFSNHLLDIPNDRSSHTQPTPRGGGLGFILAFAITSLIAALFASYSKSLWCIYNSRT
jgi:Fuc2NAc and GlcNAc transferase